jgi:hypothetical protein
VGAAYIRIGIVDGDDAPPHGLGQDQAGALGFGQLGHDGQRTRCASGGSGMPPAYERAAV